jgi:diguanylate cyclase (GGDEF)-like protein
MVLMTNGGVEIDPRITSLVTRLLERRVVSLWSDVREQRGVITGQMEGIVSSGIFVSAVTKAVSVAFESYAHGIQQDVLGLVRDKTGAIDPTARAWVRELLETNYDRLSEGLCGEASGNGPLSAEIGTSVRKGLALSVANAKRDLGIELDLDALAQARVAALDDASLRDGLVPLQGARGLELRFKAVTTDTNQPLSFVFVDIDHFKQVNDEHGGHATGNEALISVAEVAAACVKGKGYAFRLHGDEFVLLLPNHTLQEGLAVAERFRREINVSPRTSQSLTLSVSVGVAVWPDDGADCEALIKAADYALYDAKNRGRNLVRYKGEPERRRSSRRREK